MNNLTDPFVSAPPRAPRTWRQSGGVCVIPWQRPALNTTHPREFQFWLDWESDLPQTCELEVQLQYQGTLIAAAGFPDPANTLGYAAGARYDSSNSWSYTDPVIVKAETGAGSDARRFYFDLRPGRFSLGMQQRVRLSIARWLTDEAAQLDVLAQGSIGPSAGTDADPPTYTATIELAAAASASITAPPGAQWWDFFTDIAGTKIQCATAQGFYYKDTTLAAPVQVPPVTPYPWLAWDSLAVFTNLGADCKLTSVFWVR